MNSAFHLSAMREHIGEHIDKAKLNPRLPYLLRHRLSRVGAWLGALLPQDCQLCAGASGAALICEGCRGALPFLTACCPQCAMPAVSGEVCGACLRRAPHFDATLAALRYDFPADRLVLALKFGARLPLASLLADLLLQRVQSDPMRNTGHDDMLLPELLIPMPLHRTRLAARGFNQAVEISRHLARQVHLPVATSAVWRRRDTPPQSELPLPKRRANVRNAFECSMDLSGRAVAVVDDVMTTGATLDELARVLKHAGASRVENWVVARTWNGRNGAGTSRV